MTAGGQVVSPPAPPLRVKVARWLLVGILAAVLVIVL